MLVCYLMKPISSQLMLATSWLTLDEQTCLHLRWVESNTLSLWSAALTCTAGHNEDSEHVHTILDDIFYVTWECADQNALCGIVHMQCAQLDLPFPM